MMHGKGKLISKNENLYYEGQFNDGKFHGKGLHI